MNKKIYVNPNNPYDRVTAADLATARLYKSLGWRELETTVRVVTKPDTAKGGGEVSTCPQCGKQLHPTFDTCSQCGYHQTNRAYQGAWKKGYKATSSDHCPYQDKRTDHNRGVIFSRAFIKYWELGRNWRTQNNADFENWLWKNDHAEWERGVLKGQS